MEIFEFFSDLNVIVQPILGILTLINTFFLTKSFIDNSFSQKDRFFIKLSKDEILFLNKGKYNITINEISIQYPEGDGCTGFIEENLISIPKMINRFDNSIIETDLLLSKYVNERDVVLYLCFRITSDSGRHYDSICCRMFDKKQRIITRTRKLRKEIFFLK